MCRYFVCWVEFDELYFSFLVEKSVTDLRVRVLTRVTGRVDCFGCVCVCPPDSSTLCFMCTYVRVLLYCVLFCLYLLCSRKENLYVIHRQ